MIKYLIKFILNFHKIVICFLWHTEKNSWGECIHHYGEEDECQVTMEQRLALVFLILIGLIFMFGVIS